MSGLNSGPARIEIKKKPERNPVLDEVLAEINALVGMYDIKQQLNELLALGRVIAVRRDRDIPLQKISLHLVFTGPPGTGKTIVARKIGKLFKAVGLLKRGHCVEVGRVDLVGRFIGEAGQLMKDKVKEALDGVLFIDEAYALTESGGGALSSADQYGMEAVNTLLAMMENDRDRLVVIVAGYPEKMRRFLDSNVGLKSRFTKEFRFESYSHDELIEIFWQIVEESHYRFDSGARREAEKYIRQMNRGREDFGNARDIRTFLESIVPVQALRLGEMDNLESLTNEELLTFTAEDVRIVADR
jgi:SpoVK/Ycf46/Vps4 family AAA+-type ATPase